MLHSQEDGEPDNSHKSFPPVSLAIQHAHSHSVQAGEDVPVSVKADAQKELELRMGTTQQYSDCAAVGC